MPHVSLTAIEAIQAILAPALGISAVGLLLLGLYNRYSNIINRIRMLNEERRRYVKLMAEDKELSYTDNIRYMSISNQGEGLLVRSRIVRNAILSLQVAVGLFVLTSVAIAVNIFFESDFMRNLPLVLFVTGMLFLFVGVLWAAVEVHRSYKIVLLEAKAD
jgi:Protein of unknown function (DUF2721)